MALPNLSSLAQEGKPTGSWYDMVSSNNAIQLAPELYNRIDETVPGDGDCLYHCFLRMAGEFGMDAWQMRQLISQHMRQNRGYFQGQWFAEMKRHMEREGVINLLSAQNRDDPEEVMKLYIEHAVQLRRDAPKGGRNLTYGSDIEVDAFARLYNFAIEVYQWGLAPGLPKTKNTARRASLLLPQPFGEPRPEGLVEWQIVQSHNHYEYVRQQDPTKQPRGPYGTIVGPYGYEQRVPVVLSSGPVAGPSALVPQPDAQGNRGGVSREDMAWYLENRKQRQRNRRSVEEGNQDREAEEARKLLARRWQSQQGGGGSAPEPRPNAPSVPAPETRPNRYLDNPIPRRQNSRSQFEVAMLRAQERRDQAHAQAAQDAYEQARQQVQAGRNGDAARRAQEPVDNDAEVARRLQERLDELAVEEFRDEQVARDLAAQYLREEQNRR